MNYSNAIARRLNSHVRHAEELPKGIPQPWRQRPDISFRRQPYQQQNVVSVTQAPPVVSTARPTPTPSYNGYLAGARQAPAAQSFGFRTDASTPPGVLMIPAENDPMSDPFPELTRIMQMLGLR